MSLDRQAVLAATDIQIKPVKVPEWGGEIHVKTLTGELRDLLRVDADKAQGELATCVRFIIATACDAEGKLIFAAEDFNALMGKASHVLARVFREVLKVNGIGAPGEADIVKN